VKNDLLLCSSYTVRVRSDDNIRIAICYQYGYAQFLHISQPLREVGSRWKEIGEGNREELEREVDKIHNTSTLLSRQISAGIIKFVVP
jgi:hypothetical protein